MIGLYVGENESASFWQSVVNDISNRGVQDICIACIDGLAGFGKAIKVIFSDIEIQRCVIHQIRYSMTYVNSEDSKPFMTDLKAIYQAKTLELAEENLVKLEEKWNQPIHNWGQILGQFDAFFPNKVEKYMKN